MIQGQEDDPTFFMHRKETKSYHIDYVFTSTEFSDAKIKIGKFDDWIDSSDHLPLITSISPK